MRPKAEWAIDSEPIRAQGIIVKVFSPAFVQLEKGMIKHHWCLFLPLLLRRDEFFIPNSTELSVWENALGPRDFQTPTVSMATFWINIDRWAVNADWSLSSCDCKTTYVQFIWCLLVLHQTWYMLSCMLSSSLIISLLLWGSHSVFQWK